MKTKLSDIAAIIRSKNASPFELTFDVLFDDEQSYRRARDSGVLTAALIAQLYAIAPDQVLSVGFFDAARAFKATIVRDVSSGTVGDRDVFGAQQHAPLLDVLI